MNATSARQAVTAILIGALFVVLSYGIAKIADGVSKMDWKDILVRFDDWGANQFQIQKEYDEHEQAAFYEFVKANNYSYKIYDHFNLQTNNNFINAVIHVFR